MRLITTFLIILIHLSLFSGDDMIMRIGLFRNISSEHYLLTAHSDEFNFISGDKVVCTIKKGESIRVQKKGASVRIKREETVIGEYPSLIFKGNSILSEFKIKSLGPVTKYRSYKGEIHVSPEGGHLKIVNHVRLADYLIGVIESESGNLESKEYYKVQAVISRTYAMKNISKFAHEGFMLTDLTNCQVYYGMMFENPKIKEAVEETRDLVLVDEEMNYITASFYSNSGGQTVNSEDVWLKKVDYLRSVSDPFSVGKSNAIWEKEIKKEDWLRYLEKKGYPVKDTAARHDALNFVQEKRRKYFVDWKYHLILTDIRHDWHFKSTYFDVIEKEDVVVIFGRGFGHGVGLSQEGAMNMCDVGYSFLDVLRFYYTGVHLIDIKLREFYLSE